MTTRLEAAQARFDAAEEALNRAKDHPTAAERREYQQARADLETTKNGIIDADSIVLARKGALHEKLTDIFTQLKAELANGSLDLNTIAPAFLAANLLNRMLHTGDARIHETTLTR